MYVFMYVCIYWVSLSKPHTSSRNGMSVAFTKIYVEIRINGTSVMRSKKFTFKHWVIPYKCFRVCVHHVNNTRVVY